MKVTQGLKILGFVLLFVSQNIFAQTRTITGKVTDSQTGEELPFVNVVVKDKNKGVATDIDGYYKIELESDEQVLIFSFVGFVQKEVEVGDGNILDVSLVASVISLDDYVVVGYGVQRRSDMTGSVASIKTDDLAKVPASSPMQALQGRVAGLQVVSNSGAPGAGVVVRVRGVGTFNNSNPIYVVDDVILDNIDFLNAADIESIEVLKDASATTIYGSRGANGVIMVTTRKAKVGDTKPTINFSSEYSIQKLQKRISLLNGRQFAEAVNEIKPGSYNNLDAVPNTDWQSLVFNDGFDAPIYNVQFSASGATEKTNYYLGIGYFKQEGIINKSNFERISVKLNNSYALSDFLKVGNNISIMKSNQQNTNENVVFIAYRAWPVLEPYESPEGGYNEIPGTGNPLADIEYMNSFSNALISAGNFYAEADLLSHFKLKTSLGYDVNYSQSKAFTPSFYVSPQQQNSMSRLTKGSYNKNAWIWENTLTYLLETDNHRINALAGYTMQSVKSEYTSLLGENIIRDTEDFWYINPNNINPNSVANGVDGDAYYSILSYLFRVNYSLKEKYLFTATYRLDGSSKFTKKNRFAGFPALALGWNVHEESFMKDFKTLTRLKLRGSWGGVGNEKIFYTRQYSLIGNGINAVFGPDDVIIPGQTYNTTGNPDLVWETTYQTNIGFELGLFNDKLTTEMDYYRKVTNDILIDLTLPGFVGNGTNSSITQNAAKVLNSGLEFNLRWKDNIQKLDYSIGLLGSTLHNEALEITGTGNTEDYLVGGGGNTRSMIGLPVGAFYGYQVDGIFQNQAELDAYPHRDGVVPGDLRFVDVNEDGVLTDEDRTFIGSPIPTFLYGINLTAGYGQFDLSLDFYGQNGNKIFNLKETVRPDLYNYEAHVADRWTGEGTSNTVPRVTQGGYNYLPSSYFVQDGSFFRLRSVSLGYTLSNSITQRLKLQRINIYLTATNVFTLTKYTGYTPEIMGGPIDSGLDYGGYPVPSSYSLGVNVTF